MALSTLNATTPIDGRYYSKTSQYGIYFSEFGLIRYRLQVEVEYFIALLNADLPQLAGFPAGKESELREIYQQFTEAQAAEIKQIEATTNHDVKAVEYFLKAAFDQKGWSAFKEFIHFGLTSQDVNNTAVPLSIMVAERNVYLPTLEELTQQLEALANEWADVPMLARTHGQAASPTRLGKELMVFVERLRQQRQLLQQVPHSGKFGGATGNFNAHQVAFPQVNWPAFAGKFLEEQLGLTRQQHTTQIEHYDHMAARFDAMARINTILIDLCRDIWTYVSMDYFKQKVVAGEVGSSAMPHKVNPIDFENAEGNLGMANAMLGHLSLKLPISRLQRDLTDSTVSRNIGLPYAWQQIAFASLKKGLGKLILNEEKISRDLDQQWNILAEAVQTILRRENYPNPYEALKALTRGQQTLNEASLKTFIEGLDVSDSIKAELSQLRPETYIGVREW